MHNLNVCHSAEWQHVHIGGGGGSVVGQGGAYGGSNGAAGGGAAWGDETVSSIKALLRLD